MDDQRVGGHRGDRPAAGRGTDQDEFPGRASFAGEPLGDACLDEAAERESREHEFAPRFIALQLGHDGQKIVLFPPTLVEVPRRRPDAAKVRPRDAIAQRDKRPGERLDDLVVEGTPEKRMGMRDDSKAPGRRGGESMRTSTFPTGPATSTVSVAGVTAGR